MHGQRGKSVVQKSVLIANHFMAVVLVWWLLFGNGITVASGWIGQDWQPGDLFRRQLLFTGSLIYFFRLLFTGLYLLRRQMNWDEAITVSIWLYVLHIGFALMGGIQVYPIGVLEIVGIILYIFGSYLNTGSEYFRHRWKQNPANKGKLYTEGLFAWSMHINYFGDSILFIGFALVTGNVWAFILPVIMILGFVFMHIPMLDKYLHEKYGGEFEEYSRGTKKFIPFIY